MVLHVEHAARTREGPRGRNGGSPLLREGLLVRQNVVCAGGMGIVPAKKNAPGRRVVNQTSRVRRQASAEMTLPAEVEYAFEKPFGP